MNTITRYPLSHLFLWPSSLFILRSTDACSYQTIFHPPDYFHIFSASSVRTCNLDRFHMALLLTCQPHTFMAHMWSCNRCRCMSSQYVLGQLLMPPDNNSNSYLYSNVSLKVLPHCFYHPREALKKDDNLKKRIQERKPPDQLSTGSHANS